ncbi:SDR family NAD(P)-dependent oxidoreductase [Nocardia iowensis]|uniref:SDR family NAD(P)-dependent oxidoreductase n=1 Tax=Nocardia iowensis TaxID=204891 RepID=A0ABX8S0E3_NOCIO|nr:SDR family NAD(P)-dependent oxidoreductase [Nocardia iowensis]QXN94085.1 SDR family NAD(P)-dependent oxidoreductase [Nocardia iowensis]
MSVELVRSVLARPDVLDCIAIPGTAHLYVVATADADPVDVQRELSRMPGVTVRVLRRIPRLPNGNPDLAALPAPGTADSWVPVRYPLEYRRINGIRPMRDSAVPETRKPAQATGPELIVARTDPRTLPEALCTAAATAHSVVITGPDGDTRRSYADLLEHGHRVAAGLHGHGFGPGTNIVLALRDLNDYVVAVWACLLGGLVPVTMPEPKPDDLDALSALSARLSGAPVLTSSPVAASLSAAVAFTIAELSTATADIAVHEPDPDDVALLVLSSGSTGRPKLIQLTHRAIVQNALVARQLDLIRGGETSFNWLPFDHAPALVMYLLRDAVLGCTGVHAPTDYITADPLRWLDVLQRHRVAHTWSANFGYRMLTAALEQSPDRRWDLSALRTLLNAGEQCIPAVVTEFLGQMARFGITAANVVHMWGMAETATAASCAYFRAADNIVTHNGIEYVSMGAPAPGSQLRIVDDAVPTAEHIVPVPEYTVGRLQVRGRRVTPGYLDSAEANAAAFTADGWFDTGDLAFLADGKLVITGRAKEVVVINGAKHHSHTIEEVVHEIAGVRRGFAAAVGIPDPEVGTELLAVCYVPTSSADHDQIADRIAAAVTDRLGLPVAVIAAVTESEFPRTTGGKVQRAVVARRLAAGELSGRTAPGMGNAPGATPNCVYVTRWAPVPPAPRPDTGLRGPVVLFADESGVAEHFVRRVPGPYTVVRKGSTFRHTGDGYVIDPYRDEHWLALSSELSAPETVLYLWSSDLETDSCARHLVSAIRCCTAGEPRLISISRGAHVITGAEPGAVAAAATAAITAVYRREHPRSRAIHIDLAEEDAATCATDLASALADHRTAYPEIAWRQGHPHLPALRRIDTPVTDLGPLRTGGRYVVFGGAGGIGTELLSRLAATLRARLLVLGRTSLDGPNSAARQANWRRLRDAAEQADYAAIDIGDHAAVATAVAAAETRWAAPLDGVIHLAGEYRMRPLAEELPADWDLTATSHIRGIRVAAELIRQRPGAHLIIGSSLMGDFPAAGCAAYAATNALSRALAEELRRDGLSVTRVAWSLWRDTGVNVGNRYETAAAARGFLGLSPSQAAELTIETLRRPPGDYQIGIDRRGTDVRALIDDTRDLARTEPDDSTRRPDLPPEATEILGRMIGALDGFTGQRLSTHTPITYLGRTSVQMVQVHARLEAALDTAIPHEMFFAAPTLGALAGALHAAR